MMTGLKTAWGNRYLIAGVALYFALVFSAFPATDPSSVMGGFPAAPILVPVYSGVCAAVVLPFLAARFSPGFNAFKLMVFGCCLQYMGASLVVGTAGVSEVGAYAGGFVYGSGNACAIFAWGIRLMRCKDDVWEPVFLAALPVTGLALLVVRGVFADYTLASILLLPILALLCFWKAEAEAPVAEVEDRRTAQDSLMSLRPVVIELFKLIIVFGLMGFMWRLYAADAALSAGLKAVLFSLGFIFAAVVLRLFVQYSAGMDVGSFVRWAFPIAAVGLFFVSLQKVSFMVVACVLLAGTHASFEAMMRIRAIGLAHRYGAPRSLAVLGWGFAAINIGATAGEMLFQVMFPIGMAHPDTVVLAVMALLVIVGAVVPEAVSQKRLCVEEASGAVKNRQSDSARRARRMAERYGLSGREQEVCALLLDGRSGPFIRESLGLSKSTVDTHIRHIYQKVGTDSRQDLIDRALSWDMRA